MQGLVDQGMRDDVIDLTLWSLSGVGYIFDGLKRHEGNATTVKNLKIPDISL